MNWIQQRPATVLGLAFALLYAITAARTVQGFDSGEFISAAAGWGVPHPPGFPTYVLATGLFSRLWPDPAAWALAIWSALVGGMAVGVLARAGIALGLRTGASVTAAAVWGLLPNTWEAHTTQEVFATNHLVVAAIVLAAARVAESPSARRAAILGALCGLGAGVHSTMIYSAPLVAWGLGIAVWRPGGAKRLGAWLAGALAGLSTLAYLVLAPRWPGAPAWGDIEGPAEVLHHLLRLDYGAFSLTVAAAGDPMAAVARYLGHVAVDGVGLFAGLALSGLVRGVRLAPRLALVAAWALAGPGFFSLFEAPPTDWWNAVAERFFPVADLFAALLAAGGLSAIATRRPVAVASAAWALAVALLAWPRGPSHDRDIVHHYADDVLAAVGPDAILVGQSDICVTAIWEAQGARGLRPDVTFVVAQLLPAPWYAARIAEPTGGYAHPAHVAGLRLLIEHSHQINRPIYVMDALPIGLRGRYGIVPRGPVWEVRRPEARPPAPPELEQALAASYRERNVAGTLAPRRVRRVHEQMIAERYARPWRVLSGVYERVGDAPAAARTGAVADALIRAEDRAAP